MSNSILNYKNTENGKDIRPIPTKNNFNNKYYFRKCENKVSPVNKKLLNNKQEINSRITLNNENIPSNDSSKYIHCKRHPQNIINYFCENDKTFPCILCIAQHEGHSYKKFFCTRNYFDNEIYKIKKLFEDNEIKYFNNKKRAENFFSQIKTHFDQEIHKINVYFDSMISILQDKKNEFIAKMLIIYENYIQKYIKFKFIFDYCDKNYYNLNKGITFIENEVYKKGDFEYFYNLKDIFVKEINNFSNYNEENLCNKNIFSFNGNSMPIFIYPEKPIIKSNDDIKLFGAFKNTDLSFNQKGNEKENIILFDKNKNNNENGLFDSIHQDSMSNKEIKMKKTNLEILFEKSKNKNIISSINSKISNLNDSFINKQLIDTDSTLFFLNKNEVKNVFKQQEIETSKKFDKIETQINNNKEIEISASPRIKHKINNKVKYTSCNKENRNKQIIKKFLENKILNNKNISNQKIKRANISKDKGIKNNSNYLTSYENGSENYSLNNEYFNSQTKKLIKEKKIEKKKKIKNYPPNNGIKYRKLVCKRNGSLTKNINNSKRELNIHSFNLELKNFKKINKKKKIISNKKKFNNINGYFDDSFDEKNIQNENNYENINAHRKMSDDYLDLDKKENNEKNYFIRNHIHIKSMKNLLKNNVHYNNNSMINDKINLSNQKSRITDNYQKRNSFSNLNVNRSNSYRYFKNDSFFDNKL